MIQRIAKNRVYDFKAYVYRIGFIYNNRIKYNILDDSLNKYSDLKRSYELVRGIADDSSTASVRPSKIINSEYYLQVIEIKYLKNFTINRSIGIPSTSTFEITNPEIGNAIVEFDSNVRDISKEIGSNVSQISVPFRLYDIFDFDTGSFELGIKKTDYIEVYEAQKDIESSTQSLENVKFEDKDYSVCFRGFINQISDSFSIINGQTISIQADGILKLYAEHNVVTNQAIYALGSELDKKGQPKNGNQLANIDGYSIRFSNVNYYKDMVSQLNSYKGIKLISGMVFHLVKEYNDQEKTISAWNYNLSGKEEVVHKEQRDGNGKFVPVEGDLHYNMIDDMLFRGQDIKYYEVKLSRNELFSLLYVLYEKMNLFLSEDFETVATGTQKKVDAFGVKKLKPNKYQAMIIPLYCYYRALYDSLASDAEKKILLFRLRESNMVGAEVSMQTSWATYISETATAMDICRMYADTTHYVFYENEDGSIIYDIPRFNGLPSEDNKDYVNDYTITEKDIQKSSFSSRSQDYITDVFSSFQHKNAEVNDQVLMDGVSWISNAVSSSALDDWRRHGFKLKLVKNFNIKSTEYLKNYANAYKYLNNEKLEELSVTIPYNCKIKIGECLYYKSKNLVGYIQSINRSVAYGASCLMTINATYLRKCFSCKYMDFPKENLALPNQTQLYPTMKNLSLKPEYIQTFAFMDNINKDDFFKDEKVEDVVGAKTSKPSPSLESFCPLFDTPAFSNWDVYNNLFKNSMKNKIFISYGNKNTKGIYIPISSLTFADKDNWSGPLTFGIRNICRTDITGYFHKVNPYVELKNGQLQYYYYVFTVDKKNIVEIQMGPIDPLSVGVDLQPIRQSTQKWINDKIGNLRNGGAFVGFPSAVNDSNDGKILRRIYTSVVKINDRIKEVLNTNIDGLSSNRLYLGLKQYFERLKNDLTNKDMIKLFLIEWVHMSLLNPDSDKNRDLSRSYINDLRLMGAFDEACFAISSNAKQISSMFQYPNFPYLEVSMKIIPQLQAKSSEVIDGSSTLPVAKDAYFTDPMYPDIVTSLGLAKFFKKGETIVMI